MYYYRQTQSNSYIRVFNVSPGAPPMDVYVNGILISKNLNFGQLSEYLPVIPGDQNIKIYPTGQNTKPIINTSVFVPENYIINAAVIGAYPRLDIYPIPEPYKTHSFGRPCIRFINLSPDSPPLDVTLSDGTKLFTNIGYKDITDYACIPNGTYNIKIASAGTNIINSTLSNVQLNPNTYYTLFALGRVTGSPHFEAMLVSEPRQ